MTHVGRDRLEMTAKAPASVVERALHVKLNVYKRGHTASKTVCESLPRTSTRTPPSPIVPARLGLQTISGLSNVDSPLFFTDIQLSQGSTSATSVSRTSSSTAAHAVIPHTRSGGYYPR